MNEFWDPGAPKVEKAFVITSPAMIGCYLPDLCILNVYYTVVSGKNALEAVYLR